MLKFKRGDVKDMIYYWTIYAVFCIVHLILCFKEKENVRKITKIFIIPMLVLGLVLHQTFNLLLYIGLILGWIGDVCLIFTRKKRYFVIGTISFCLGHISYVIATLALFLQKHSINDIPIFVYILLTIIAIFDTKVLFLWYLSMTLHYKSLIAVSNRDCYSCR